MYIVLYEEYSEYNQFEGVWDLQKEECSSREEALAFIESIRVGPQRFNFRNIQGPLVDASGNTSPLLKHAEELKKVLHDVLRKKKIEEFNVAGRDERGIAYNKVGLIYKNARDLLDSIKAEEEGGDETI